MSIVSAIGIVNAGVGLKTACYVTWVFPNWNANTMIDLDTNTQIWYEWVLGTVFHNSFFADINFLKLQVNFFSLKGSLYMIPKCYTGLFLVKFPLISICGYSHRVLRAKSLTILASGWKSVSAAACLLTDFLKPCCSSSRWSVRGITVSSVPH